MCPECGLPPPEPHFQGVTGRVDTGAHGSRASPRPRPTLRPGAARVPFLSPRAISWSLMTDRRRAHAGGEAPGGRTRPRLPRGPVPRGPGPRGPGSAGRGRAPPQGLRRGAARCRRKPAAGRVPDGVVHQVRHGAAPWAPVRGLWGAHVADAEPWGGRVTRGVCTRPRGTAGPHRWRPRRRAGRLPAAGAAEDTLPSSVLTCPTLGPSAAAQSFGFPARPGRWPLARRSSRSAPVSSRSWGVLGGTRVAGLADVRRICFCCGFVPRTSHLRSVLSVSNARSPLPLRCLRGLVLALTVRPLNFLEVVCVSGARSGASCVFGTWMSRCPCAVVWEGGSSPDAPWCPWTARRLVSGLSVLPLGPVRPVAAARGPGACSSA